MHSVDNLSSSCLLHTWTNYSYFLDLEPEPRSVVVVAAAEARAEIDFGFEGTLSEPEGLNLVGLSRCPPVTFVKKPDEKHGLN